MIIKNPIFTFILIIIFAFNGCSQNNDHWSVQPIDSIHYKKIDISKNKIENSNSLFPLLTKLYKVKHFSKDNVVFVHIGDSHTQADITTSVIRNEFQKYFGNAGRGMVFPYQVAKTNAPYDIASSSNSSWKWNRVTKIDTLITCGISAFGLESSSINPSFSLSLKPINDYTDSFDKVKLFMGGNVSEIQIDYNNQTELKCYERLIDYEEFILKEYTSGFNLTFPTTDTMKFFGASLEKNESCGIIYHSIGSNGATYADYNKTSTFWKQLKKLNADCYIISLGTNEAQEPNLTAEAFLMNVKTTVDKIRSVSPDASIILTTPPVSYYKKTRPNPIVKLISHAIIDFCNENNLAYWDLFGISNELEGAKVWRTTKFLRSDLVHFSKEAYEFQGAVFVDAFTKAWNDFMSKY